MKSHLIAVNGTLVKMEYTELISTVILNEGYTTSGGSWVSAALCLSDPVFLTERFYLLAVFLI